MSGRRRAVAWATPEQELLLHAVLAQGDEAVRAWEAWSRAVALDDADGASHRLLPLLYRRLADAGVEPGRLARLKGVYRHAWYRNQVLVHHGGLALRALADAGVATIVLKGAALALRHYRDLGARPMDDLDVLVRRPDAGRALDVLEAAGWRPSDPAIRERVAVWHADWLADEGGRTLDLHWDVDWQLSGPDEIWAGSVPLEVGGAPTRALGDADALLHVCVHGLRWAPVPPVRWIADAALVVTAAGAGLDWDRFVSTASASRVSLAAGHALGYLRERFAVPVPPEVLARLAAAPKPVHERLAYRASLRRPTPLGMVGILWDRHRRLGRAAGRNGRGGHGFLTVLQRHARLERRSQLPRHLLRTLAGGRWRTYR